MQKLNVIAKISGYFSAVLLHWNCKRIFKCSDMQHTSLTPDAELISLTYGTLFYVNMYGCYKLLKTVRFLAHHVLNMKLHC